MSCSQTVPTDAGTRAALVAAISDFAVGLNRGTPIQGDAVLQQLLDEVALAAQSQEIWATDDNGEPDRDLHTLISRRGPEVGPLYEYASVILAGALCRELERRTGTSALDLLQPLRLDTTGRATAAPGAG